MRLPHVERPRPEILAVERHQVESVELHLGVALARMQRVEVGNAVNAQHDGLAINDELLRAVLQCCLDNPGIPLGPVVPVAGDQAHA